MGGGGVDVGRTGRAMSRRPGTGPKQQEILRILRQDGPTPVSYLVTTMCLANGDPGTHTYARIRQLESLGLVRTWDEVTLPGKSRRWAVLA